MMALTQIVCTISLTMILCVAFFKSAVDALLLRNVHVHVGHTRNIRHGHTGTVTGSRGRHVLTARQPERLLCQLMCECDPLPPPPPPPTSPPVVPVVERELWGRKLWIKRDDLLEHCGAVGNKARKLRFVSSLPPSVKVVVSYGGVQSNAMASLASMTSRLGLRFIYISKRLPKWMVAACSKSGSDGDGKDTSNFALALASGMEVLEVDQETYKELHAQSQSNLSNHSQLRHVLSSIDSSLGIADSELCFIPQGAATPLAEVGVQLLIDECWNFLCEFTGPNKPWKIVMASGTGTMALFAARHLRTLQNLHCREIDAEIVAAPCVGTRSHLLDQIHALDMVSGKYGIFPEVLSTESSPKHTFAEPSLSHLTLWKDVQRLMDMETFDLLYSPRTFELLKYPSYYQKPHGRDEGKWISLLDCDDYHILYYHCGGSEGNQSQLKRYTRKGLS